MNKLSSHNLSSIKYKNNCKYTMCHWYINIVFGVLIYGSVQELVFAFDNNYPATSTLMPLSMLSPMQIQQLKSASLSPVIAPSIDSSTTSTSVESASLPIQGWQCHCWNSTNNSDVEGELECRCEGSALVRIPQRLHSGMQKLTITQAGLALLRYTGLKIYALHLEDIMLTDLQDFQSIEPGAFSHILHLRTIYISHAPKLKYLAADVFEGISLTFRSLRIMYCGLLQIPDMRYLSTGVILNMIDLEGNQIHKINERTVSIKTEQFILDNNALSYINNSAFQGSEIAKLSLKGNRELTVLHPSAFAGIENIQELDLSSTSIEALPTEGLHSLEILRIQNTHSLKTIPSVYNFKNLQIAWLTHPFHCCAFQFPSRHDPHRHAQRLKYLAELKESCISSGFMSSSMTVNNNILNSNNDTTYKKSEPPETPSIENIRRRSKRNFAGNFIMPGSSTNKRHVRTSTEYESEQESFLNPITGSPVGIQEPDTLDQDQQSAIFRESFDFGEFHETTADVSPNSMMHALCGKLSNNKITVKCFPMPDALNPCEDVMGSQWLRSSVWIVVFLAVFGNVAVLVVLFSNWSKTNPIRCTSEYCCNRLEFSFDIFYRNDVTVPKFLMSHLAFADLCLGLYLLLIATIDLHSMGEYFNFAYDWQYGSGCKVAGFLTVFASHLSVFTLTIITIERWFAITNAINLNKRIKLKAASLIMASGWIYSIFMSTLPLFGVSNYSSTSICLPMEARDSLDVAYLILIIGLNGFAFFIIAICYSQIYFSLGKETRQAARYASRGEMTVAKKMALLVFTNFACWAPIAFFGLTALAGVPLIDVAKSKILLVFFYPLNSCADPYLYAILTAQYRRDLFMLLSRYGFCTQKAQQYKTNYSLPTNHTIPLHLTANNNSTSSKTSNSISDRTQSKKFSLANSEDENFV